jgi:hypothetical protein
VYELDGGRGEGNEIIIEALPLSPNYYRKYRKGLERIENIVKDGMTSWLEKSRNYRKMQVEGLFSENRQLTLSLRFSTVLKNENRAVRYYT